MARGRRLRHLTVCVAVLMTLSVACGGDESGTVSEPRFTAAMTERFGSTEQQSACITEYVFADYDPAEIEVLTGEAMGALPQARWGPYLNAVVDCLTSAPRDGDG